MNKRISARAMQRDWALPGVPVASPATPSKEVEQLGATREGIGGATSTQSSVKPRVKQREAVATAGLDQAKPGVQREASGFRPKTSPARTKRVATKSKPEVAVSTRFTPAAPEVPVSSHALAAVAMLKGIPASAIGAASGIPAAAIEAYFSRRSISVRPDTKRIIADFLGVDLQTGRLRDNQVHVFNFKHLPLFETQDQLQKRMEELGLLLRDSRSAAVAFPCFNAIRRAFTPAIHVLQNDFVRVIFIGARRALFKATFRPEPIPGCRWVLKTEETSTAGVFQREIAHRLLTEDVTPIEFDEIFHGKEALSWKDVEVTARVHQVTKREVVDWIETVGENRTGQAQGANLRVIEGAVKAYQESRDVNGADNALALPEPGESRLATGTR